MTLLPKTYTCSLCKEEYETDWSDQEALEEYASRFEEESLAGAAMAVVCDDCYQAMDRALLSPPGP